MDYKDGGTPLDDNMGIGSGGNMTINYTRDGNFDVDHEGNLVTSDGHRVMGYLLKSTSLTDTTNNNTNDKMNSSIATEDIEDDGNKIKQGDCMYVDADGFLQAVNPNELQPLKIPDEVYVPKHDVTTNGTTKTIDASWQKVQSVSIGKDGVIKAVLADGNTTALGQIAMASFKNPAGLTAVGGNLYEVSANSGETLIKTSINIDKKVDNNKIVDDENAKITDNSKGFGDMIQGCLEASNVDLTEQFTDMITATRSFQASSKMITTGDEILQTITGLMR